MSSFEDVDLASKLDKSILEQIIIITNVFMIIRFFVPYTSLKVQFLPIYVLVLWP